jgi:hypothetical protein
MTQGTINLHITQMALFLQKFKHCMLNRQYLYPQFRMNQQKISQRIIAHIMNVVEEIGLEFMKNLHFCTHFLLTQQSLAYKRNVEEKRFMIQILD